MCSCMTDFFSRLRLSSFSYIPKFGYRLTCKSIRKQTIKQIREFETICFIFSLFFSLFFQVLILLAYKKNQENGDLDIIPISDELL